MSTLTIGPCAVCKKSIQETGRNYDPDLKGHLCRVCKDGIRQGEEVFAKYGVVGCVSYEKGGEP